MGDFGEHSQLYCNFPVSRDHGNALTANMDVQRVVEPMTLQEDILR